MATDTVHERARQHEGVRRLIVGDRLTRAEFERRYDAMPDVRKAELIEGVVHMPSPVRADDHGEPHFDLIAWMGLYRAHTPGVAGGDNSSLKLDLDNMPQPDTYLRILAECGGRARIIGGYVTGSPELIGEVTASTASYDLHDKLHAYRRNGVQEYVVWRVWDLAVGWFVLREGQYDRRDPDADGVFRSEAFPGLWLDARALVEGDLARVLSVLQQGLADPAHAGFIQKLEQARNSGS